MQRNGRWTNEATLVLGSVPKRLLRRKNLECGDSEAVKKFKYLIIKDLNFFTASESPHSKLFPHSRFFLSSNLLGTFFGRFFFDTRLF